MGWVARNGSKQARICQGEMSLVVFKSEAGDGSNGYQSNQKTRPTSKKNTRRYSTYPKQKDMIPRIKLGRSHETRDLLLKLSQNYRFKLQFRETTDLSDKRFAELHVLIFQSYAMVAYQQGIWQRNAQWNRTRQITS